MRARDGLSLAFVKTFEVNVEIDLQLLFKKINVVVK